MKFLHEMIAKKRDAHAEVSEIEGPETMGVDGFDAPEPLMRAEHPASETQDTAEPAEADDDRQHMDAAEMAEAEAKADAADDQGYDWDLSSMDLGDLNTDAAPVRSHAEPDPAPQVAPQPGMAAEAAHDELDDDDEIPVAPWANRSPAAARIAAAVAAANAEQAEAPLSRFENDAADLVDPALLPPDSRHGAPAEDDLAEAPAASAEPMQDMAAPEMAPEPPAEPVAEAPTHRVPSAPRDFLAEIRADHMSRNPAPEPQPEIEPEIEPETAADADFDAAFEAQSEPEAEDPAPMPQRAERPVSRPKIWDLEPAQPASEPSRPAPVAERPPLRTAPEPAPAAPEATDDLDAETADAAPMRRKGGRVKTRLLGFNNDSAHTDPISAARSQAPTSEAAFPVGWLVVIAGPGRGASFTLMTGASTIGRGEDQAVRLDFGDTSISRENHAVVAYDDEQRRFFMGHGGKANLVRLNGMPVLSTEPLSDGDTIRIGETTMKFVGLCGPDFSWGEDDKSGDQHAAAI